MIHSRDDAVIVTKVWSGQLGVTKGYVMSLYRGIELWLQLQRLVKYSKQQGQL